MRIFDHYPKGEYYGNLKKTSKIQHYRRNTENSFLTTVLCPPESGTCRISRWAGLLMLTTDGGLPTKNPTLPSWFGQALWRGKSMNKGNFLKVQTKDRAPIQNRLDKHSLAYKAAGIN